MRHVARFMNQALRGALLHLRLEGENTPQLELFPLFLTGEHHAAIHHYIVRTEIPDHLILSHLILQYLAIVMTEALDGFITQFNTTHTLEGLAGLIKNLLLTHI